MSYFCLSQYKNLKKLSLWDKQSSHLYVVYVVYVFQRYKILHSVICIFPHFIKNISIFYICDSFLNNIIIWFYLSAISFLYALFCTLFFKNLKKRGVISVICGWMALDEYFKSKLQKSLRNLYNRYMFIIQCLHEKIDFQLPRLYW